MAIEIFLNDTYKILNLLYENQTKVLDKKVIPLTQQEISSELGMSKAKVNILIGKLQDEGYILLETKGKYSMLDKGISLVEDIKRADNKLSRKEGILDTNVYT